MDIYPITLMYHLFKPDALQWPINELGNLTLKLEHLSQANQLATGQAHNAMVDVIASLVAYRNRKRSTPTLRHIKQQLVEHRDGDDRQILGD